ncbi:hypothetical protein SAMN04489724_1846 [Algoriphagus locisalis]|uniref:Uncharacterized protein n=1 Tax=Algoriphagus locisalis TaxID=305507 RepID=A0A1I7ACE8_9BACT|nr:hypothetical protein [Algoriphagus locisalis]SFT72563.1 hypothetical protein SAMN04489724_1846 [Algoriphagus locisalis]
MITSNKLVKTQVLISLMLFVVTPLFAQVEERGSAQFFFKDGKSRISLPFLPVYNQAGEVEALADSVGVVSLPIGESFQIRSLFYRDTVFQVVENRLTKIILEYEDVALQTFEIKFFKDSRDHVEQLSKRMSAEYISSPHLGAFSGYFLVRQKGKILDFFEADGLSLLSGNKKWKPWDFANTNSSGDSYNHLVPMEIRRSFHWNIQGDTIAVELFNQSTRDKEYGMLPFYSREIYRALEVSGPLDEKSIKYYDFKYGVEDNTDVIYFNVKDQFKLEAKLPLFLVGEGVLYLTSSGEMVDKLIFNFSSYKYLNLQLNRSARNREISGVLSVSFDKQNTTILPTEIGLEAKFFGERNLFPPRPFELGNEASISEKMHLKNYKPVNEEDLENLREAMLRIGLESMVPYNPNYWRGSTNVSDKLYAKVNSDLGKKIPLEKQFLANSGKRLHPWPSNTSSSSNKKNDSSIEELTAKKIRIIEDLVGQLRALWVDYK